MTIIQAVPNPSRFVEALQCYPADIGSELLRVTSAIEAFDGTCDPAFDNELEELERQFAELRVSQARGWN